MAIPSTRDCAGVLALTKTAALVPGARGQARAADKAEEILVTDFVRMATRARLARTGEPYQVARARIIAAIRAAETELGSYRPHEAQRLALGKPKRAPR